MMSHAVRLLTCTTLLLALSACNEGRSPRSVQPEQDAGSSRSSSRPAEPDWEAMKDRVPNAEQRIERSLDAMKEAKTTYEEWLTSKDPALLEKAQRLYDTSGDIYEELWAAAEEIHPKLWEKAFRRFDRTRDGYASNKKFRTAMTRR